MKAIDFVKSHYPNSEPDDVATLTDVFDLMEQFADQARKEQDELWKKRFEEEIVKAFDTGNARGMISAAAIQMGATIKEQTAQEYLTQRLKELGL